MKRQIETTHPAVSDASISTAGMATDAKKWLADQAQALKLKYLLAHAEDGVIWGRYDDGAGLITSGMAAGKHPGAAPHCPDIRSDTDTLRQARLFGESGELLAWRDGDGQWQARLIRDAKPDETPAFTDSIDETHILWGTLTMPLDDQFTLMTDGAQGMRHAAPRTVTGTYDEKARPLRLKVRHYVQEDATGFARIVASRLVDVTTEGKR